MDSLLAHLRRARGFSQKNFAEKIGSARSNLAMIETGQRMLDVATAVKAAEALSTASQTIEPADVVLAASQGDLMQFWGALVGAVADLISTLLRYV